MIQAFEASRAPGAAVEHFLGIPVTFINYSSSVIPIILASWVSCWLERKSNALLPSSMKTSSARRSAWRWWSRSPSGDWPGRHMAEPSAGQRLPVYLCVCAMAGGRGTGRHVAGVRYFRPALGLVPLMINNMTVLGHDSMLPIILPAVIARWAPCSVFSSPPAMRASGCWPVPPSPPGCSASPSRLSMADPAAAPSVYLRLCRRGDWRGDHRL